MRGSIAAYQKVEGNNSWFTERSPTTVVYWLQGRCQLTDRWTGTCRIRSCSGTETGLVIRTEFLQGMMCVGILNWMSFNNHLKKSVWSTRVTEDREDPRFHWKDTCFQFSLQWRSEIVNTTYIDDQKSSYTDYIHFNTVYNDEKKSSYTDNIQ
jgi:hypothetical protein